MNPTPPPFPVSLKFSLLQGATTMNSPNTEILHQVAEQRSAVFKAAHLFGWKALNNVRMLVVHLAVAVCASLAGGIRPRMCH